MTVLRSSFADDDSPDFASTCLELIALVWWIFFLDEDVCFTAHFSSFLGSNVPGIINYDRVTVNKGSGYNTADGVFTASRDGTYLFIWNSVTNGGHYCQLLLYKNGRDVGLTAYSDGLSGHDDSGSISVVLELTVGDRVWVHNGSCGYSYGGSFVSFSGCKIWRANSTFERYIIFCPLKLQMYILILLICILKRYE